MICIIRIKGQVGLKKDIVETLNRLRLRRKYTCVVLEPTPENLGMLKKVKDFVAYGEISKEMLEKLNEKRGKKGKSFYRLHPPRKGIKSKLHFPRGVLGNHREKINELVEKML